MRQVHCVMSWKKPSQSAYEPEAGYNRRFREVSDAAYPTADRNDDQNRILIRAYARRLRSSELARKLVEEGAPSTLEEAIKLISGHSTRKDAYARLSRTEEPMEVGTITPKTPLPILQSAVNPDIFQKLLKSQEQIVTKLEKIALQSRPLAHPKTKPVAAAPQFANRRPRNVATTEPRWTPDGRPICLHCLAPGHMRRECPQRRPTNQGNGWRS